MREAYAVRVPMTKLVDDPFVQLDGWTMQASSILKIMNNLEELLGFFETFSAKDETEAGYKCAGYFEKCYNSRNFFLCLYCHAMNPVEDVNEKVQGPHLSDANLRKDIWGLDLYIEWKA
ncbi:hypothetical protein J6590_094703 [Homalodisca vitripennis]|nr:hypothetical protein J6590_094703 [Homalodisca vitripennis]